MGEKLMRTQRMKLIMVAVVLGVSVSSFATETGSQVLRLAKIFGSNMVLQRDQADPVWGWAAPGASVAVTLDKHTKITTVADAETGKWMVKLPPLPAGGPHTLTVTSGQEQVILKNILVGDVWICSGQSNMQWPVWTDMGKIALYTETPKQVIAHANYDKIRLYITPMVYSYKEEEDVPEPRGKMYPDQPVDILRKWRVCSPETLPPFSAVGYFFGRAIHRTEKVPVGLIQTAWGGTVCEAWTSVATLLKFPEFHDTVADLEQAGLKAAEKMKAYQKAVDEWQKKVASMDAGFQAGEAIWAKPDMDDSGWASIEVPGVWEEQGYPDLDGYVWFRKIVRLPKSWAGKPLELHFTAINDMNQTWVNGVQISDFKDQPGVDTPRTYTIPGKLVKAGSNLIAVRVYDMGRTGGFVKGVGVMELRNPAAPKKVIPLGGIWKMKPGITLAKAPKRPAEPRVKPNSPNTPSVLYNAMIHPLIPFAIKGAIWYQGESNADRAYQYRTLFPAMITDWRTHWGEGDFPFLFVQLANFTPRKSHPVDDAWAELREAQTMALSLPNTGMAVTIDIGDAKCIHPKNKQDVGERLALAARHVAYGENVVYSGPMYKSMKIEGDKIRLYFEHVGSGLESLGGGLTGFAIAGKDRKFHWACARIEGQTVVVWSADVPNPVAVRYGWDTNPLCNLYNKEGLPASPFRTDDWPGVTVNNK